MTHTIIHQLVCPRCKRTLTIANPRSAEAIDEQFRRDFPDAAAASVAREEVCDDCYQKALTALSTGGQVSG